MSILKDVYHITEATSADFYAVPLLDEIQKNFLFDIDILSELDNVNADIFWNFGDPFCEPKDNELVIDTIVESIVNHTYTYAGMYKVHSIVTINGVLFHIEKYLPILPDNGLYVESYPPASDTYENIVTISLSCFDSEAKIYYEIEGGGYNLYTEPFTIIDSTNISYYATLSNHTTSPTYSAFYVIIGVAPVLTITPSGGTFSNDTEITVTSDDTSAYTIYYTTDGVTEPTSASYVYTAPLTADATTTYKFISINNAVPQKQSLVNTVTFTIPLEILTFQYRGV